MSITRIKVNNFRSIEKLDIELPSNSRVLCFVGENGSSKTSVLSLIVEAIVSRSQLNFPNHTISDERRYRMVSAKEIRRGCRFYSNEVAYSTMGKRNYEYKKLVGISNSVPRGDYVDIIDDLILPAFGFPMAEKSSLDGTNPVDDFLFKEVFLVRPGGRYENYDYEVKNKTETTSLKVTTAFDSHMPYPFFVAHSGSDVQETILNMLFDSFIGYSDTRLVVQWITPFLEEITGKKFGTLQVSNMPFRQLLSSEVGEVNSFSQGELDLLVTIVNVIKQQLFHYGRYTLQERGHLGIDSPFKVPGIVIIDEVDLHLHPRAQESYVKLLTEKFPNIQFVVTTHSPFIIRGLPKESVVVTLPNGRVFSSDFHKMDIDSIVSIIFQYSGRFSIDVVKKLEEFRGELVSENPRIEKLKSIFSEFSDSQAAKGELELYLATYGTVEINQAMKGE